MLVAEVLVRVSVSRDGVWVVWVVLVACGACCVRCRVLCAVPSGWCCLSL